MKKYFIFIFLILLVFSGTAYASTRAAQIDVILNGLVDKEGSQLAGGIVYFYSAGTDTAKSVYTDKTKTAPYSSYTLDAYGRALLYGEGVYKFKVYDSDSVLLYTWDNIWIRADNFYQRTVTGTATATTDDDFLIASSDSGVVTITLVAADDAVKPLEIKRDGSNTVTIDGRGAETIDGSATISITIDSRSLKLISDGSNWKTTGATVNAMADADQDTKIQTEESDDEDIIRFDIGGTEQINLQDGKLLPTTDNDIDLGASNKEYKKGYFKGIYANTIDFNGVTLTPSATEINQLNTIGAVTISYEQWVMLGGSTPSFTELNQLATIDGTTISAAQWATLGGASETLTSTELNQLDTLGAVTVSANQWAALGGIAETVTYSEIDQVDGIAGPPIAGDATAGRVLRSFEFHIGDANDDADLDVYNADVFNHSVLPGSTGNIVNNDTTGNYTLNDGSTMLKIESTGFTGNAVAVISADIKQNETTVAYTVDLSVNAGDIVIYVRDLSGAAQDMRAIFSDASELELLITYITDS